LYTRYEKERYYADIKFEIEKELGSISELNPVIADYKSLKKAILCI